VVEFRGNSVTVVLGPAESGPWLVEAMETSWKYRFGPFELRTTAREISKHGIKVKVRGQPYLILETLLARAGQVVTREELREKLWPAGTFVDFEHGLNTSLKKLRQALCDSAEEPRYIETLPRLGYRFIAPVEAINEKPGPPTEVRPIEARPIEVRSVEITTPPSLPVEVAPQSNKILRSRRIFWLSLVAATALCILLLAMFAKLPGLLRWRFGPRMTATAAAPEKRFSSIAVLPLENLSNDPAQEYFADGMTDELITDLAQLGSLRVISRTSVMHYKGGKETVPQIGRELGVDALIEGTVERVDNRVRIRVQLIDTVSDRHLWASTYDHELKDVLLLQSTAARDIAAEIQGQEMQSPARVRSLNGRPVQPEAYEAYLKGRYFWNQRSEAGLKKSVEYFQDAITRDSTFAAAYAGLAGSYSILGSNVLPPDVARTKARAAASKALELDPAIAEGHAELGLLEFYYDWDWKHAETEFQRAIELNPSYATAHQWYSQYLRAMGRLPEALHEAKQAQQLDPLSLPINTTVAARYRDLNQYDLAIATNRHTLELNPDFPPAHEILATVYEQQGNLPAAIVEWKKVLELTQDDPSLLSALGHAYAISGNQAAARKIAIQLQRISKQHYVSAWDMAVLFTGLGDQDSAFRWLEKSYQSRESQLPFLNSSRLLDPLRTNPRFQELVRRVGLPT
jgi:TolB-like protein/DNA-binding winged helix-turn-helix (wHTH) protein/tetratricopeptide (TPR) repeat protein